MDRNCKHHALAFTFPLLQMRFVVTSMLLASCLAISIHAKAIEDDDSYSEEDSSPKRAPWQSYHWEEDKDKRSYNNEHSNMDVWSKESPWASHEWDKRWASYDLRSRNHMLPDKRDPWAYPKTDIWSYISRRGRGRFLKTSNKRTNQDQLMEINGMDYEVPSGEVIERILATAKQPARREVRSLEQTILDIASKRHLGRVKDSANMHPVNMGLGQHAAGYALDTYSQLLANEQRRLQEGGSGGRVGGAPVRFIGK